MGRIEESDLVKISYQEFGETMEILMERINQFLAANRIVFDVLVPILRSGAPTAIHIASRLDLKTILPVFYMYEKREIVKKIETPTLLSPIPPSPRILIVDSNTTTGTTVKEVRGEIKRLYPNARLYFAAAWIDQSVKELPGIEKIFYGKLTNEEGRLSEEEAERMGVIQGVIVAPWEDLEITWKEINK